MSSLMFSNMRDEPVLPSTIYTNIQVSWDDILRKALAKQSENRPIGEGVRPSGQGRATPLTSEAEPRCSALHYKGAAACPKLRENPDWNSGSSTRVWIPSLVAVVVFQDFGTRCDVILLSPSAISRDDVHFFEGQARFLLGPEL